MPVFFCPALSHEKTKARGHVDPHPSPLHMEAFQKLDATWRGHGETTTSSRRFQGGFFHPWFFTNLLMSLKLTAKTKPEKLWQRETIFILSIWSFKGLFSGTNSWLVLGTVSVCLLSYECYIMKNCYIIFMTSTAKVQALGDKFGKSAWFLNVFFSFWSGMVTQKPTKINGVSWFP